MSEEVRTSRVSQLYTVEEYFAHYPTEDPAERPFVEGMYERYPRWLGSHPIFAIFAHNLKLAELMMELTAEFLKMSWLEREVSSVAIVVGDRLLDAEEAFMAHAKGWLSAGTSWAQLASIDFPDSTFFDEDEKAVMEFTRAAFGNRLSDDLFDRLRSRYGDKEMFEFTIALSYYTFFPRFIKAMGVSPLSRTSTVELWESPTSSRV